MVMTTTEIKKALYKEKPIAILIDKAIDYKDLYTYVIPNNDLFKDVYFEVPTSEMDGTEFKEEESAQHLIRWLKYDN